MVADSGKRAALDPSEREVGLDHRPQLDAEVERVRGGDDRLQLMIGRRAAQADNLGECFHTCPFRANPDNGQGMKGQGKAEPTCNSRS